jgi:hypothetical protein
MNSTLILLLFLFIIFNFIWRYCIYGDYRSLKKDLSIENLKE